MDDSSRGSKNYFNNPDENINLIDKNDDSLSVHFVQTHMD